MTGVFSRARQEFRSSAHSRTLLSPVNPGSGEGMWEQCLQPTRRIGSRETLAPKPKAVVPEIQRHQPGDERTHDMEPSDSELRW